MRTKEKTQFNVDAIFAVISLTWQVEKKKERLKKNSGLAWISWKTLKTFGPATVQKTFKKEVLIVLQKT